MKLFVNKFLILGLLLILVGCDLIPYPAPTKMPRPAQPALTPQVPSQAKSETPTVAAPDKVNTGNIDSQRFITKKIKVGILLPFSGKNKELGWQLLNVATMSLFDNDNARKIELVLIDEDSSIDKILRKIDEQKIKIVIGPVFSTTASAIKNRIKDGVTFISLSNNQGLLADTGKNNPKLFVAGFLPDQQIDRVVTFAIGEDASAFAILAPSTQFGGLISDLSKISIRNKDGNLVRIEFYNPSAKDVSQEIERAMAKIISSFAAGPNTSVATKANKKPGFKPSRTRSDYNPKVIMVAEPGKNLAIIAKVMQKLNKDQLDLRIAGVINLDNTENIKNLDLTGLWFSAPKADRFSAFSKAYYQTYGNLPPRISSIIYDLVAALSEIADEESIDPKKLPQEQGFAGIDGMFRFLPNGLVQRNYAILTIENSELKVLDEPLEKFLNY